MKFHKDGTLPENDEIFVFGSNLGGIHGSGAARVAREQFDAVYFVGVGPTGNAYGIPTKNETIEHSLPLVTIKRYVDQFIEYAHLNRGDANVHTRYLGIGHSEMRRQKNFFVTGIGCGLAGFDASQIAPMFSSAPDNCSFPDTWKPYL